MHQSNPEMLSIKQLWQDLFFYLFIFFTNCQVTHKIVWYHKAGSEWYIYAR